MKGLLLVPCRGAARRRTVTSGWRAPVVPGASGNVLVLVTVASLCLCRWGHCWSKPTPLCSFSRVPWPSCLPLWPGTGAGHSVPQGNPRVCGGCDCVLEHREHGHCCLSHHRASASQQGHRGSRPSGIPHSGWPSHRGTMALGAHSWRRCSDSFGQL